MDYNTLTLPNGLRIIHLPSSSPVLYCGIGVYAGTRHELADEHGLAHFCEHATFKGTAKRRSWHIVNCLESVGGDLNAFTNKETTFYYAATLADHAARAVDVLTDIVFRSTYPAAELEKEAEVVCDEIESYNDTPSELIYDEFEDMIFSNHALGHNILGTAESVRRFGHEHVERFARRHYRPANAVFYAYGAVSFDRLVRLVEKASADIATPTEPLSRDAQAAPGPYTPQQRTADRATHQAHVMLGNRAYSAHDPRNTALYLINNILGGPGMNARLNLALREHHGLVYTVESSMTTYSDTGAWCAYFGCDHHDVGRCLRLVRHELDRLMDKPLSATQLAAAKKQIKGQIAIASDNREAFAIDFAKTYLVHGRCKSISRLFERIDALTADDLLTVARETFDPEKLSTLIYGK